MSRSGEPLARQPDDGQGPVFGEPWEAAAFAIAVRLSEAGLFTWPEWAAALSAEIRAAGAGESASEGEPTYYASWLAALEKLVLAKGAAEAGELEAVRRAWAEAASRTPHGQPIELVAGDAPHAGAAAAGARAPSSRQVD